MQSKPVILMIDEVDKSTDNQLFLSFLGMLRNKYLDRKKKGMNFTFHFRHSCRSIATTP